MEVLGNRIHIETDIYIWGIYCAVGALCALTAIGIYSASRKMKQGSAPLLGLMSLLLGILCSRVLFCLFTTLTKTRMSFSAWLQAGDGGWTMFGLIGGVMLAGWLSGKILRENTMRMLDAVSVALPLFMAAERLGEAHLDELFNYNQFLSEGKLSKGLMTVADGQGNYMIAAYRVDAILILILFLILAFSTLSTKRRDGDLWIRFMTLCGAGGVLGESLRTDDFLMYSFVYVQQVLATLLLLGGIIAAGKQAKAPGKKLFVISVITLVLTVAECVGIEFSMDRILKDRWLPTGIMTAALCIPVMQVMFLQRLAGKDAVTRDAERETAKAVWIALVVSATETVFIASEILRVGISKSFPFLFIVLAGAVLILALQVVTLLKSDWRGFLKLSKRAKEN